MRVRFREPDGRPLGSVLVNGKSWKRFKGDWVELPGDLGHCEITARFGR